MNAENGRGKGIMLALTAAVLWGVSGAFAQFLMGHRGVGTEWLVTVRLLGAGGLLLIFSGVRKPAALGTVWRQPEDRGRLIRFSLFGMLAVQYTFFAAIRHSNAATATVLQFAAPVMIAVWLSCRRRKWPAARESAAILLATVGMLVLVTHGRLDRLALSGVALFWGLASAVALAFYSLQAGELLKKYPASILTGWAMLTGGLTLALLRAPGQAGAHWDLPAFLALSYIIVFGTLVPFHFYMVAVRLAGGQITSLLLSVEPLAAALVAVLWLDVSFGRMDWIGGLLVLGSLFLLARPASRKQERRITSGNG